MILILRIELRVKGGLSLRDLPCFKLYKLFHLLIANKYRIDFFKAKKKKKKKKKKKRKMRVSLYILIPLYIYWFLKMTVG